MNQYHLGEEIGGPQKIQTSGEKEEIYEKVLENFITRRERRVCLEPD